MEKTRLIYMSEKLFITATHVTQAATTAKKVFDAKQKGEVSPLAEMKTITDVSLKGLRLINVNGVASWVLKTKTHTKTFAYIFPKHDWGLTAPEEVRELGGKVKALLLTDPDSVDDYLDFRHGGKRHDEAMALLRDRSVKTWTFEKCIEQTIADKTASDTPEKDQITEDTVKDYRTTFNREIWKDAKATPAVLLSAGDIEKARNHIRKHSGTSPAIKSITYTRAVLNWCAKNHGGESGLDKVQPWWIMLNAPYEVKPKSRTPTIENIVKTMILAEAYLDKPLPGRAIRTAGTKPGTLAALWWLVLTCQRATAGLSLLAHDVVDDDKKPGWKLVGWAADVMKAGQAHSLPFPDRAWTFINQWRERNKHKESQDWAFPSEQHKDKHATNSGVYRIVYRLANNDTVEQKKKPSEPSKPRLKKDGTPHKTRKVSLRTDGRDLLAEAGIDWWSMHDCRRSLTSFLDDQGIPGGASVILAHEIDEKEKLAATASEREREDFNRQRTARITRMAYGGAQYIKLKQEAIELWTNAVLDEYDRQKSAKRDPTTVDH